MENHENVQFFMAVSIAESFRRIIQSGDYERIILGILNRSVKIFGGKQFQHIDNQPNGQPDYVDNEGQKYDVKLVLDKKQGQLIGDNKNDFRKWITAMIKERGEFESSIVRRDLSLTRKTKLYRIIRERLETIKPDEVAILFFTFPIVSDEEGCIHLQLATDFLQAIYQCMVEDGLAIERKLYFIYPSLIRHIYILRSSDRRRESIRCEEMGEYISYDTQIIRDSPI